MRDDFFKFPSTPHLARLGGIRVRDDKVMIESERDGFLQHELVVEEKVDGANLGISFDPAGKIRAQNRGEFLQYPYLGQWKKLAEWLDPKIDPFFDTLSDRYILFGEWCYAQHSVPYDRLPDWFLGFDVFDKSTSKFFSCSRRDALFRGLGVSQVPTIKRGRFSLSKIKKLLSHSQFSDCPAEGLYLRLDNGDWLRQRAKLVRPEFIRSVGQHWSRTNIRANKLKVEARS